MRTQSRDTSPEIEQFQIGGLRAFAPAKKFASTRSISASMHFLALRSEGQDLSDYERAVAFLKRSAPASVVDAFRAAIVCPSEWALAHFDLLPPLERMRSALEHTHSRYALTGALARALYGFPCGVRTIELLVDLKEHQITTFAQGLQRDGFLVTSGWLGDNGKPPSVCFLDVAGLVSIELRLPNEPPWDVSVFSRAHSLVLDEHLPGVSVLAPEEVVLQGVVYYQTTGARDEDLYNEILGVLKIQAPTLDQRALIAAAPALGVQAVVAQLFEDAGLTTGAPYVLAAEPS
jgi:hypothetical protein